MARFERRGSRSGFNDNYSPEGRNKRSFAESRGRRDSGRSGSGRGSVEMTRVVCDSCGDNCEVPFKPTSSKPIYCNHCFSKNSERDGSRSNGRGFDKGSGNVVGSSRDLDMINEKLNKIMEALDIQ